MIQCGEGTIFSSNNVVNIFITIQRNTGICWNAVRSENAAWKTLWAMLISLFIFLINLLQFLWLFLLVCWLQKRDDLWTLWIIAFAKHFKRSNDWQLITLWYNILFDVLFLFHICFQFCRMQFPPNFLNLSVTSIKPKGNGIGKKLSKTIFLVFIVVIITFHKIN